VYRLRLVHFCLLAFLAGLVLPAGLPAQDVKPLPDPGTLENLRGQVGKVFFFEVTGTDTGSVYGTDVYTDDSSLATAAVHAGVIKKGEKGVVRVTILPGRASYAGSGRNGINSLDWNTPWGGSFTFARPGDRPLAALPDPGTLEKFRAQVGRVFLFEVTGSDGGAVYGTGVYTDDSSLATAAVHAGVLKKGEKGVVRVTILPGRASYTGSGRNGINSLDWNTPWDGSFTVARRAAPAQPVPAPADLQGYRGQNGTSIVFQVTGKLEGSVWGTDVYTDDSALAAAVVHAGLLRPGQTGLVRVTILPGRENYAGSTRNGVTSSDYAAWNGSYRVEAVRRP